MHFRTFLKFLVLVAILAQVSCSVNSGLYDWGTFEDSLEKVFDTNHPQFLVNEEIERLAKELEKTPANRIPPGKTAHLGYLYASKGDTETAKKMFKQEKVLFPESGAYMERLIKMLEEKDRKGTKK